MQILTKDQSAFATTLAIELARWAVSGAIILGLNSIRKMVKSIRPGIVDDVTENVKSYFDSRLTEHEALDTKRFDDHNSKIEELKKENGKRFEDIKSQAAETNSKLEEIKTQIDQKLWGRQRHPATGD